MSKDGRDVVDPTKTENGIVDLVQTPIVELPYRKSESPSNSSG